MNPDGRWTVATPATEQPHTTLPSYQGQYPGDSAYLPQPDYSGHPAMRPTLPSPDRHRLQKMAVLITTGIVLVTTVASILVFHYATEKPSQATHHTQTTGSTDGTDSAHQQQLKQVQGKLEAYFTETGHYPINALMNSADWRKANMPGLSQLTVQYTYKAFDATKADCGNTPNSCSLYTLTILLSNGKTYTLKSINS